MIAKNKEKNKDDKKKIDIVKDKLNKFFNHPAPLIIFLILIIFGLLIFIASFHNNNIICVGSISEDDIQVSNLHYFINDDMNYFYAAPATTTLEDRNVYSYQIGYYVKNNDGQYIEFTVRENSFDKEKSLNEIIKEMSSWNFGELNNSKYFFRNEVIKNMDKLHFIVKASTKKDIKEFDIVIDKVVNISKITK